MLWYEQSSVGNIVSSRVRLARNLKSVPFPSKLDLKRLREVNTKICDAVMGCGFRQKLRLVDMETLGEPEAFAMVERHIISPKFAMCREGRFLIISDDESISIMIGEEDHLRFQVILPGQRLKEALELCDELETLVSKRLEFAFDERLGYLTECPTNLGTGMRASVMLHLPLLERSGELKSLSDAASKIGLTFRGFYGEGSESKASLYQLSNQITLGVSEGTAIENLKNIAMQISEREQGLTDTIDSMQLYDTVCRSLGVLKYAGLLTTKEMMRHLSVLMLGIRAKIVSGNLRPMEIFITQQPAMIKRIHGDCTPDERDILRAKAVRRVLRSIEPLD